jgi:hypothetical protein
VSDPSPTCTCQNHPELHCLRHPGLSQTRLGEKDPLVATIESDDQLHTAIHVAQQVQAAVAQIMESARSGEIPLPEPESITKLRKVLSNKFSSRIRLVQAAQMVLNDYDLERARMLASMLHEKETHEQQS